MSRILSHPFRFIGGRAATVDQASDEGNAEQIAVLILTRRGERMLVPDFGIDDPTFDGVSPTDISLGLTLFGPPVVVEDITTAYPNATTQEVTVHYAES